MEKHSALAAMKARLEEARLAVRRAVVKAPESGVIFERRAMIGSLSTAGEPMFRIARNSEIEAELRVPEGDASRVTPSSTVRLSITGVASILSGTVRLVSPRIDASDRSAAIRVAIPGYHGVMVGGFVHGSIDLDTVTAPAIPSTAVQRDTDGAFVWIVDAAGHVARQTITILLQQDGLALVAGITPDLRVVARAGSLIHAGDFVKMTEAR
jgi:HlyD family secretion protein